MNDSLLYRAPSPHAPAHAVGAGRLVLPGLRSGTRTLRDELALGFLSTDRDPAVIRAELASSGLRGRGGAGFPMSVKVGAVAAAPGEHVLVANGHEGEPASAKDRWLLLHRPHLVVDGILCAASAIGARRAVVYVSDPDVVPVVSSAIDDVRQARLLPVGLEVDVHLAATRGYVAGEESAVCQSLNGGPAKPTSKPPRPFEAGVDGLPTLISNVETLAQLAWIHRNGADEFAAVGTASSSGTALFTLTGAISSPGVYEMPLGGTVADLVAAAGGTTGRPRATMFGGWFGGILDGDHSLTTCCYDALRTRGTGLGCAAVTVLGEDDDLLAVAAELGGWYRMESANQCGVCINGTGAIARTLGQLARGDDQPAHLRNLVHWGNDLSGRGACAFIDGASTLARTVAANLVAAATIEES